MWKGRSSDGFPIMNVSKFYTFSRTCLCLSLIAVINGSHSFATEAITATLVSDKDRYIASEDITLTLTVTNASANEETLASLKGPLFALGIYKNTRLFSILPDPKFEERTITLPANESIVLTYSFPAFRIASYAPHFSPTATSTQVNVQGPWLKDHPTSLNREDVVVDGVTKLIEVDTTGNELNENALLLKKNIRQYNLSQQTEEHFVELDYDGCQSLSEIPEIQTFVKENLEFDGLVADHRYITGGGSYDERIVILCTRNDTIETVVLRTWAHIQSDAPPRVIECYELSERRKVRCPLQRYDVLYESTGDHGFMKVTDNWTGNVVFDASSVWGGPGAMRFPRRQETEEIRNLHREQLIFRQSISRDIYISWKGSKYELETFLYQHDYRIKRPTVSENSPHARFLIAIPPGLSREEATDFLKTNPNITVWELKTVDGYLMSTGSE